jgi:hypothetical protein
MEARLTAGRGWHPPASSIARGVPPGQAAPAAPLIEVETVDRLDATTST